MSVQPLSTAWRMLLGAGLLAAASAQAQVPLPGGLTLAGFGTAGVMHQSGDVGPRRDDQPGDTARRWDAGADSNLGLQADWAPDPRLGASLQALARRDASGAFGTRVEWGFVRAQALEALQLRLGRLVAPVFAQSESRWIGLTQPMLRPPQEVYGLALVQRVDGADLRWKAGAWELQATGGRSRVTGVNDAPPVHRVRALSVAWTPLAGLLLRAGRLQGDVQLPSDRTDAYAFDSLSVVIDRPLGFAMFERARRRSGLNPADVDADAWSLAGGWRLGRWMPFAGMARTWGEAAATLRLTPDQSTRTLGLRWDLDPGLALKLQADRVRADAGASGPPAPPGVPSPPERPARRGRAVALALDFVF